MRESVLNWWYGILRPVDGLHDRQLARAEFAAYYGSSESAELGPMISEYIRAVFALCDGDGHGRLSRRELAGMLRVHGVAESEMSRAMQQMRMDHAGGISEEKCTRCAHGMSPSNDSQSPGIWFLGDVWS
jgi:Ca2+-binding EF-hand superfamily protein